MTEFFGALLFLLVHQLLLVPNPLVCVANPNIGSQMVQLSVPGVTHVAIWRSRAFLLVPALPHTLFETSWQPYLPLGSSRLRRFPIVSTVISLNDHCSGFQQIKNLKTDSFGRLWVLDKGNENCAPKLVVYDLFFYTLTEIHRHTFELGSVLNDFVVDSGTSRAASVAYFSNKDRILVFNLNQGRSWRVNFSEINEETITGLTLVKTHRSALILEVSHLVLYRTFTTELIGSQREPVSAEKLGNLLGPNNAGLASDLRNGGIYYMLTRDFVALRWNSARTLIAENHEIMLQSDVLLRNVTSFANEPISGQVWAVVNDGVTPFSWCVKISND